MTSKQKIIERGRLIAKVLRHQPSIAGVLLDKHGWCSVSALVSGLANAGTPVTEEQLQEVIQTNNKRRFALSADGLQIRASQGHTLRGIDLQLPKTTPPPVLYHGTVAKYLKAIQEKGLLPMSRHHVHLSLDMATATKVGARRGPPVILVVDAFKMHQEGHEFWVSDNGVWLTTAVPSKYLKFPD